MQVLWVVGYRNNDHKHRLENTNIGLHWHTGIATFSIKTIIWFAELSATFIKVSIMENMNLLPVETGSGLGGAALGAFGGALIGSWFGDGFGGRNGLNNAAVAGAGVVGAAVETGIILDSLNSINAGVNATNMSVLTSANQLGNGMATLGFQASQNTAQVVNATTQGFAGLNTAIQTNGFEGRLATQTLAQQMQECCCETQKTILVDGQATRALIDRYAYEALQTQLCDAKSTISTLESNAFTTASNAHQTQVLLSHLQAVIK